MTGRVHSASVYAGLRTAVRLCLSSFGAPDRAAEAAARLIGSRCGQSLRDYADRSKDKFIPVDVAADLEAESDYPHIAAALAAASGYLLVPGPGRLKAAGSAAITLAEAGETVTEIATAFADGRCDHGEAPAQRRQLAQMIIASLTLDAEIAAQHPESGPPLGGGS